MQKGSCLCGAISFSVSGAARDPDTGVALGALDGTTGLRLKRHIFTADKGDYYDIEDNVPQEEQET